MATVTWELEGSRWPPHGSAALSWQWAGPPSLPGPASLAALVRPCSHGSWNILRIGGASCKPHVCCRLRKPAETQGVGQRTLALDGKSHQVTLKRGTSPEAWFCGGWGGLLVSSTTDTKAASCCLQGVSMKQGLGIYATSLIQTGPHRREDFNEHLLYRTRLNEFRPKMSVPLLCNLCILTLQVNGPKPLEKEKDGVKSSSGFFVLLNFNKYIYIYQLMSISVFHVWTKNVIMDLILPMLAACSSQWSQIALNERWTPL